MTEEEKKAKRFELLEKLVEVVSHGSACVTWADRTIITIEDIDAKESKITK